MAFAYSAIGIFGALLTVRLSSAVLLEAQLHKNADVSVDAHADGAKMNTSSVTVEKHMKKKFKLSPELVSALHDQLLEVVPKSDANAAWSMLQPILEETPDLDTLHELMVQSFQGHEAEVEEVWDTIQSTADAVAGVTPAPTPALTSAPTTATPAPTPADIAPNSASPSNGPTFLIVVAVSVVAAMASNSASTNL